MFSTPVADPPATGKIKHFAAAHWRGMLCIMVPIILAGMLLPEPKPYTWCAYTLSVMAIFWVTECIPLAVTSMLPVFIFPFSGVMDTSTTMKCYFNDTVIMFLGSLILAAAVEQSGLHIRLALCCIRCIGYSHYKLLFAMGIVTMFVSMWIANTAATTMMVPINFALLNVFTKLDLLHLYDVVDSEEVASEMTTCYFCCATFSATIGGIGTLIGTGTNLVFKGLFQSAYPTAPEYLSFPLFSAFAVPYMLCMELAMYFCMIVKYLGFLRPGSKAAKRSHIPPEGIAAAKAAVNADWERIGAITFWEIMVIILFGGGIVLFFCRSPQMFPGWADLIIEHFGVKNMKFIRDSALACAVIYLMFLFPSNMSIFKHCTAKYTDEIPKGRITSVLDWRTTDSKLPYSFCFLLGGGFALSTGAKKDYSDLNGKLGEFLRNLRDLPNGLIILIIIIFTVFITNFASNVAMCNVVAPIAMQLAKEINKNPLWYNIVAGYSASYCFCLPVGTPGNLLVQSAAKISTKQMIVAGAGPTLTTIIISWFAFYFWAPVIWPDLHRLPEWSKIS